MMLCNVLTVIPERHLYTLHDTIIVKYYDVMIYYIIAIVYRLLTVTPERLSV
jgi:hypothetical protein